MFRRHWKIFQNGRSIDSMHTSEARCFIVAFEWMSSMENGANRPIHAVELWAIYIGLFF